MRCALGSHGASNLARQAQSKEKALAKMVAQGLTPKVERDHVLTIRFDECGKLPPPIMMFQVSRPRHPRTPRSQHFTITTPIIEAFC